MPLPRKQIISDINECSFSTILLRQPLDEQFKAFQTQKWILHGLHSANLGINETVPGDTVFFQPLFRRCRICLKDGIKPEYFLLTE